MQCIILKNILTSMLFRLRLKKKKFISKYYLHAICMVSLKRRKFLPGLGHIIWTAGQVLVCAGTDFHRVMLILPRPALSPSGTWLNQLLQKTWKILPFFPCVFSSTLQGLEDIQILKLQGSAAKQSSSALAMTELLQYSRLPELLGSPKGSYSS